MLDRIVGCFEEASLGFVGGRVLLFDPTDFPITIQELDHRVEIEPCAFVPAGLIHGANFAFRREVLEAIGGFDPGFGAGTPGFACEDVDAVARAAAAGWWGPTIRARSSTITTAARPARRCVCAEYTPWGEGPTTRKASSSRPCVRGISAGCSAWWPPRALGAR